MKVKAKGKWNACSNTKQRATPAGKQILRKMLLLLELLLLLLLV